MGFLSAVPQCITSGCGTREEDGNRLRTRVIPEMSFTCSGTVTHWRAAGVLQTGGNANRNSVLSIWRERSGNPGTYDRVGGIELGICGSGVQAPLVMGMNNSYECSLPQNERLSVQSRDIVGIELSTRNDAKFRLYFDSTNGGPTNYVFSGLISIATLSQTSSTVQDQPQIALTVEPNVNATTVLPTSQGAPTSTEASSTDPLTIQPPTTGEPESPSSTTQPSTTTRATASSKTVTVESTIIGFTTEIPTTGGTQTMQAPIIISMTDNPDTESPTTMTTHPVTAEIPDGNSGQFNSTETGNSGRASLVLIVGLAMGGGMGIILLSPVIVILILVVVFQSRKYKRYLLRDRETVTRIAAPQNFSAPDIEMKANDSYIPVLGQISTENNVAYGEMGCVNQESNDLYETIDPPIEDSTMQLAYKEQNEDDCGYDIVN